MQLHPTHDAKNELDQHLSILNRSSEKTLCTLNIDGLDVAV